MTVKELLLQLAPTLSTHEVCVRWGSGYSCLLCIDIVYGTFHAYTEIERSRIHSDNYYLLTEPFSQSFYKKYNHISGESEFVSVLDDFKVRSWSLEYIDEDRRVWKLAIDVKGD